MAKYLLHNFMIDEHIKNALQEDKLKGIQKRLKDDGLPVGVAVLLYGAPGTGKTESVMQIAKETGRAIVHVDIGEAKSAWFGESEKRIKKIFTSYKNACEIAERKCEKMPKYKHNFFALTVKKVGMIIPITFVYQKRGQWYGEVNSNPNYPLGKIVGLHQNALYESGDTHSATLIDYDDDKTPIYKLN